MAPIPYQEIKTLFLDVGNTMISMDFNWVCFELQKHNLLCNADELQRAEAASRPVISNLFQEFKNKTGLSFNEWYLTMILMQLPQNLRCNEMELAEIAKEVSPLLFPDGTAQRLWSFVLQGVPEALARFKKFGMQMVVVSNADGTVEQQLIDQGLRPYFDAVVDSHIVGFSKPDPRIFHLALEISGANPEHTLHVGDIFAVDVVGARDAGLHALLLDPYHDWQDVDCERLPDLLKLAEKFSRLFEAG